MRIAHIITGVTLIASTMMAVEVPRKSPEFAAALPQGGQLLLSQYRGKVVCIEFLFTTCPHCQATTRLMNTLYDEYGTKGFQPLGVAFNDANAQLVTDYVRQFNAKYPIGYATRDAVTTYLQLTPESRLSVPQIVFIDRKGVIRQQSLPSMDEKTGTEQNIRHMIETLLSEPASTSLKKRMPVTRKKPS